MSEKKKKVVGCAECTRLRAALEHIADRKTHNSQEALIQLAEVAIGVPEKVGDWWAYCGRQAANVLDVVRDFEAKITPHILRNWDRGRIVNFANHLLGDVCQECQKPNAHADGSAASADTVRRDVGTLDRKEETP